MMMTNQAAADCIRAMARAEIDGDYSRLRQIIRLMSLEDLQTVRNVIKAIDAEVDQVIRVLS